MQRTGILLVLAVAQQAAAQGINFTGGDWDGARTRAEAEAKLVFIDVYTDWCGPCKIMARDVFPQPQAGELFNRHYISVQLDAEDGGHGQRFAEEHGVAGYPTLLIFDPVTGELGRIAGKISLDRLLEFGSKYPDGSETTDAMRAAWRGGSRDLEFVERFLARLQLDASLDGIPDEHKKAINQEHLDIAAAVFFSWPEERRLSKAGFDFTQRYRAGARGAPIVEYMVEHYEAYAQAGLEVEVSKWLSQINDISAFSVKEETAQWRRDITGRLNDAYRYRERLRQSTGESQDATTFYLSLLLAGPNIAETLPVARDYLEQYGVIAWRPDYWHAAVRALNVNNHASLPEFRIGVSMAQALYLREPSLDSALEYARLLDKTGQHEKAAALLSGQLSAEAREPSAPDEIVKRAEELLAQYTARS